MSESNQETGEEPVGAVEAKTESPRHVLLVEDEELVALAMADELRAGGWTVIGPATTLEQAQAIVVSGDIPLDAAILDVHLQGRWVHTLAEELDRRGVPFVVCTGYEMVDPDGRFASAPMIVKPIAPHRLGETLDALLNRSAPVQPPLEPGTD